MFAHVLVVAVILFSLMSFPVNAGKSNNGEPYISSGTCGEHQTTLRMNTSSVKVPTISVDGKNFKLKDGPSYHGPVCVTYRKEQTVGYIEYTSSYEKYRVYRDDTRLFHNVTESEAIRIGF
jgi:hypothetical protein